MFKKIKNIRGQVSAEESDFVLTGQLHDVPLITLFPLQVKHTV